MNDLPETIIRSSNEDDIEGIRGVLEASAASEFALVPPGGEDSLADEVSLDIIALEILTELSDPDYFLSLVAEQGGRIVGYARCWLRTSGNGVGSVSHVGVLPDHQGQGIAGKLIAHLIARATANKNFKRLELEVAEENSAAVSVYQKAGFNSQPTKVSRTTLAGEQLHLLMYRDLTD